MGGLEAEAAPVAPGGLVVAVVEGEAADAEVGVVVAHARAHPAPAPLALVHAVLVARAGCDGRRFSLVKISGNDSSLFRDFFIQDGQNGFFTCSCNSNTRNLYKAVPRFREWCRQIQAEEVSNSRSKILKTWERP